LNDYAIGIDWGGTRLKIGAVAADGSLIQQQTHPAAVVDETFHRLLEVVQGLIDQIGPKPVGIGIGLSGPVNPDLGVVLLPGKIKGLQGHPVVPNLRRRFGVPVWATNDGLAAMYAEKYFGHARGKEWAVSLTIGTGVGSGVLVGGRILNDPHFMFGTQVGHLVIDSSDDQLCLTGARGTAEMLCSATALALAVRSGLQRGIPSTLSERYWKDAHSIDFKVVIEDGVAKKDRLCLDELDRWTRRLGWLIVSAVHAYSPEVVILSGGATAAAEHFLAQLQDHVDRHIFRYPPGEGVPIAISRFGDYAGVLGAAVMVRQRLEGQHD
jgi:glucokinase